MILLVQSFTACMPLQLADKEKIMSSESLAWIESERALLTDDRNSIQQVKKPTPDISHNSLRETWLTWRTTK